MLCPARGQRAGSATKNVPYVIKLQNPKKMSTITNKAPMNIPRISFNLAAPKNLCLYLPLTKEINLLQEMALRATTPRASSGDHRCTLVHLLPVLMGLIPHGKSPRTKNTPATNPMSTPIAIPVPQPTVPSATAPAPPGMTLSAVPPVPVASSSFPLLPCPNIRASTKLRNYPY